MKKTFKQSAILLTVAVGGLTSALTALAANDTWSGASLTSGNWNDAANWDTLPGSGDLLFFAGSTQLANTNDFTGYTFTGVTVNSGAGAFNLYGNSFSLAGGITNLATTTQVINNNITLGGNQTINAASGAITLAGILDAGGNGYGLTFPGAKNVTLTGVNTYSGPTVVYGGGTLIFGGAGCVSNSSITLGRTGLTSGSYLSIGSSSQPAGVLAVASNLTVTASILGGNNFNNLNTAAPAVNVTNQFTGALQLKSGLFRSNMNPNSSANMQYLFNGFSRSSGTVWSMDRGTAPGINTIDSATAGGVNIVFDNPPSLVGGGGAAGTATVGVVPGVFISNGNATYDTTYGLRALTSAEQVALAGGMTTPSQNAIVNANTTLGADSEVNALMINGSFTISLGGYTLTVDSGEISDGVNGVIGSAANDGFLALGAEGIFNVANARALTINSVITGSGGLTINLDDLNSTGANVVLAGTNTFTGVTRVLGNASMTLKLNNSLALQNSTLDYNNYGGTITFNGPTSFTFGGLEGAQNLAVAVPLTLGSDGDSTTYSGVLSGAGSLTKVGSGAFTLTGANTYAGGTTLSAGQLNINNGGSSSANSAIGIGALTIGGGTIDNTSGSPVTLAPNNSQNWNGDFTFNGSSSLNLGTGLVALGGNRQVTVNANNLTVGGVISGTGYSLTKLGAGTLSLSAANSYSGNTIVSGGTLALTGSGSIGSSPSITVANGATLNVSGLSTTFTLGGGQSLLASGVVNGPVTTTSGSQIYADAGVAYGTNTFNNNLTLVSGAVANFQLGTAATGANDLIVVGGNLTNSANTINISAPSTSVNLATSDYTLFTVGGTISGSFAATPNWVVQPLNAGNYSIVTSGNTVKLHYQAAVLPSLTATATPASASRGQSTVITATVTPGTYPISSVTVNAAPIGGASSVSLVQSNASSVYTNTVTVGAGIPAGSTPLTVTATDNHANIGTALAALTILPGMVTWNGASGTDNNWSDTANWVGGVAPLGGDAATFAGTARLTPLMDNSYTVSSLNFSSNAGSFVVTNAPGTSLTLVGNGVTNNAVNAQTLNVPMVMSTAQTFNTTAGSITLGGVVSGGASLTKVGSGANTLTLVGSNTYGGGTLVSAGTIAVANNSALGSGVLTLGGGSISNAAGGSYSLPNNVTVSSAGSAGVGTGDTFTLSGLISGGGTLTKIGTGTLVLPNANNLSGGVTVNGGTLVVANNSAVGGGLLTLGNASISNSAGNSYSLANPVNLTGSANVVVGTGDTFTLSGAITNFGGLNLTGGGTLSLPGADANTYSGGTVLAAGTLRVGNTSISPLGSGNLTFAGGTLADGGAAALTLSNNLTVVTNTTSYLNPTTLNGNGLTLAGNISGPGNIVVNGSGTTYDSFSLSGTNSGFTGTLTVNNSSFQRFAFGSPDAGSANAAFVFNSFGVDNQKFNFGGTNTIALGSLSGNGQLRNDGGASLTTLRVGDLNTSTAFNGLIVGNGGAQFGLLKVGTGTLTMTNNNTFAGLAEIAGGTLTISVAQGATHSYQVDDGATLGVINYAGSGLFVGNPGGFSSLTVGTNAGATLMFSNLDGSAPYGEIVATTFTNNGTCTVVITDTNNLVVGNTYHLVGYGTYTSSGAGTFVLSSPYVQGTLVNDTGNGYLDLTVTNFSSVTVNPNPTNITASVSGGNLSLTWPGDHLGWYLQAQTNSLTTGLGTNWVDVPGSSSVTNVVVPIVTGNPAVFYRMSLNP